MNKTKRIVSTLVLLSMLCMLFAALPTAAATADGNLLTNGALADADADGIPDGWSLAKEPSLVTPDTEGYTPLTGWAGNYLKIEASDEKGAGLSQDIRSLELGELYKASVLYTGTTKNLRWDLTVLYYADANATAQIINDTSLELKYTYTLTSYTTGIANFIPTTDGALKNEVVFKMPTIKDGTLPEGASIGLRIKVSTSAAGIDASIADIRLEKTKNWVANGSFENGLSGWTKSGSSAANAIYAAVPETYVEGTSSAKLQDDNNALFLKQSIYVEGGKTYRVRFWFKASESVTPRLGVLNAADSKYYAHFTMGTNVSQNSQEVSDWHQFTYYFTTKSDEPYITIRLSTWNTGKGVGLGKTIYFDDISVTEVKNTADIALYSPTTGEALTAMPAQGATVECRATVKVAQGVTADTADILFAVYELKDNKKKLMHIDFGGGTAVALSKHNYADVATNFVEVKDTFTIPDTLNASGTYMAQAFVWKPWAALTPIGTSFAVQTIAK